MKRPTKTKVNKGPENPHSRKDRAEKTQKFISDCEASLIRLIDQKSRETRVTWCDLFSELQERFTLLRRTYPNHKGKVIIAIHNVEEALKKVQMSV